MDSEIKKQINTINQKINELNALYRNTGRRDLHLVCAALLGRRVFPTGPG